ncbi:hypothetical protein HY989_00640 [Candidatus Micrarchaeota archaeon]|nr:hypothetical protein [Candidatus Micrarchaeota archaeon]
MEGVELSARFGSVTNHLKYCGPVDFGKAFSEYLGDKNKRNEEQLKHALTFFEGHYPYLKLIGKENGLDPFNYKVCEAYWLGNELLEKVSRDAVSEIITHDLVGKGKMQIPRAQMLAEKLPKKVYPHHSFHVYYIKFITGKVDWNLFNADRCRTPFGKVVELKTAKEGIEGKNNERINGAIVEYKPVLFGEGKYFFGEEILRNISFYEGNLRLTEDIAVGDWIAFHWDVGIMKINERERGNLKKFTDLNLETANLAFETKG